MAARNWALAALCPLACGMTLQAQKAEDLLRRVDSYRYPWSSFGMEVGLQDGAARQQWRVTVRENGDARVEGLSDKEKGRVVLLLGEQMWLVLPGAKRPVKVSPQQRLMGPAAGGDIARFRFSGDYLPVGEAEDTLDGRPVRRLDLKAARKSMSYQKAVLWVAANATPVKSEFYYLSGKLARTVVFGPLALEHGAMVLSGMKMVDPSGKAVEMQFTHWKPLTPDPVQFQLPEAPKPTRPDTTASRP